MKHIRDDYLEVKYADQMRDYLSQIVNNQFGESKMYYAPAENHYLLTYTLMPLLMTIEWIQAVLLME